MTYKASEKAAIKLLKKYKLLTPPVNVEYIIRQEGIRLSERSMKDEESGFLVIKGANAAIGVNKEHHSNRQRFTLAHELGHYILHRDTATLFVDSSFTFYRDESSSKGKVWREIQANAFAAELLMPRSMLIDYLSENDVDLYNPNSVSKVAEVFEVSEQALTIRLTNLGILST